MGGKGKNGIVSNHVGRLVSVSEAVHSCSPSQKSLPYITLRYICMLRAVDWHSEPKHKSQDVIRHTPAACFRANAPTSPATASSSGASAAAAALSGGPNGAGGLCTGADTGSADIPAQLQRRVDRHTTAGRAVRGLRRLWQHVPPCRGLRRQAEESPAAGRPAGIDVLSAPGGVPARHQCVLTQIGVPEASIIHRPIVSALHIDASC